jgi:hypothetical protein
VTSRLRWCDERDWGDYSPFDPGVSKPLHEVTRREARAAFGRLVAAKDDRVSELRRLLERNGVALTADDAGLQVVNDWFRQEWRAFRRRVGFGTCGTPW